MTKYECDECGQVFISGGKLGAHISINHRPGPRKHEVSSETLLKEIRRLEEYLGHPPTAKEMHKFGRYSARVCQNRFGSWNKALSIAGCTINHKINISDEELGEEIDRLVTKLNRPPSSVEMREIGLFSLSVYLDRYGTWENALIEAGYEKPRSYKYNTRSIYGRFRIFGDNWAEQREKAIERDGSRCATPGCDISRAKHLEIYNRDIHVHHLVPRIEFWSDEEGFDSQSANAIENLVTVCEVHHPTWEKIAPLRYPILKSKSPDRFRS